MHIQLFLLLGVGKTSLVHLIMTGSSIAQPPQTIGCNVAVKVIVAFWYSWKWIHGVYSGLSWCLYFLLCSMLHMEAPRAHRIISEATRTEIFLLNSGIYQDMKDTRTVDLYSILKLMVDKLAFFINIFSPF